MSVGQCMGDLYYSALFEAPGYPDEPKCQSPQCDKRAGVVVGTLTPFNFLARLLCEEHGTEEFERLAGYLVAPETAVVTTISGVNVVAPFGWPRARRERGA